MNCRWMLQKKLIKLTLKIIKIGFNTNLNIQIHIYRLDVKIALYFLIGLKIKIQRK